MEPYLSEDELSATEIMLLIVDYFPHLNFFCSNNDTNLKIKNLEIKKRKYYIQEQGKWTFNIAAMSESTEEKIAHLFPQENPHWDEMEARKRYDGSADIIRFFIYEINNSLFTGFFNSIQDESVLNVLKDKNILDINSIPSMFFADINYYNDRNIWDLWDFSLVVTHKPTRIYDAFFYYARRKYTLLSFALNMVSFNANDPLYNGIESLLEAGKKAAIDAIHEQYSKTEEQKERRNNNPKFYELIADTLESVPQGSEKYAPLKLDKFIERFYTRLPDIVRPDERESGNAFTHDEQREVNSYIIDIEKYVGDSKSKTDLEELRVEGRFKEKILLLYRLIGEASIKENYSQEKQNTIRALYYSKQPKKSLDKINIDDIDDDGNPNSLHDQLSEEGLSKKGIGREIIDPAEHILLTSAFEDELRIEFDNENDRKTFLEYIPDHFDKYPLQKNIHGILVMNENSKNKLFEVFCSYAGIQACDELRKHFLISIQRIIDKFNQIRRESRSKQ